MPKTEARPHTDSRKSCRFGAVLYLSPNVPPKCGTSFFRQRMPNGSLGVNMVPSPHDNLQAAEGARFLPPGSFVEDKRVDYRFNRLVLYRADLIHSATRYYEGRARTAHGGGLLLARAIGRPSQTRLLSRGLATSGATAKDSKAGENQGQQWHRIAPAKAIERRRARQRGCHGCCSTGYDVLVAMRTMRRIISAPNASRKRQMPALLELAVLTGRGERCRRNLTPRASDAGRGSRVGAAGNRRSSFCRVDFLVSIIESTASIRWRC